MNTKEARMRRKASLMTPTNLGAEAASLFEVWIDEAEKRVWFLFEACRRGDTPSQ
jgi:starvation-inducible DNA-binding protein